jgi:hypothetical protein
MYWGSNNLSNELLGEFANLRVSSNNRCQWTTSAFNNKPVSVFFNPGRATKQFQHFQSLFNSGF